MARRAVLDESNTVVNVISAGPEFTISGFTLVPAETDGSPGDFWNGSEFIPPPPPPPVELSILKVNKKTALAAKRYQVEISGVNVDGNVFSTDRESQPKYIAVFVVASANPAFTTKWKLTDGSFVTLDATAIQSVALGVQSHIQTAFAHESSLIDLIDIAETEEELNSININEGW